MKEQEPIPEAELEDGESAYDDNSPDLGEVFATWDFPGHEAHERSKRWYIISALLIVALLIFALYDNNPLLVVIIFLALIAFIVTEVRGPDYHSFAITEDGLVIGPQFYPYTEMRDFYIIYQPPHIKILYIEPKNILRGRFAIPLEDQDPVAVRSFLIRYLPENIEKEDEPFSEFIGRLFKF